MKTALMYAILLALFCNVSCKEKKEKKEETSFAVTSPLRKDTLINREYVCQIRAIRHIDIRTQERGYLKKVYIDEGQLVKKGQRLFQIMPKLYQAELNKAKAEAKYAQIEYLNTKKLADSGVVAPNELALSKANYDKAKAEVLLSQAHVDFTDIRAPFDGIIDRFYLKLGSLVDEGELLTTLSDNSEMWIYFNVPEAEYLNYKSQMKKEKTTVVKLKMANNEIFNQDGVVETIEADFNNATGNIAFRATFPNPNALLRHGETGSIIVATPIKNALLIPQKCTYEILDKQYVFVVDKDSIAHSQMITVANELPHLYVLEEGLKETDKILLEGLRKVSNNSKISYEFETPDEVISHLELYAE